jgi:hypothetical protein
MLGFWMAIRTRFVRPLGGSVLPAKYVVEPHPASTIAATRHPAALYQRLLFFKIASLKNRRGQAENDCTAVPQLGQMNGECRRTIPSEQVDPGLVLHSF